MTSHDLTYTIAAHLDRHMVLPLLEFAQEKELYDRDDLMKAKLQLVSGTKMLDFAQEEYKALHKTDKVPPEMQQQRQQVYAQLEDWKQACLPLLQVIVDVELVKELKANNQLTYDYLSEKYKVNEDMLANLYRFAKLTFDCGRYRDAADYLFYFRLLSADEEKRFWALWGMLAAEILMTNWDAALEYLNTLRDAVDMRSWVSGPEQLQQRTWLIHWSLFIFFNIQDGRQAMIDFLFNDRLVSTIQNNCPHILRYLTVAVIINRRRKNSLKDLIRVLRQVDAEHRDPITQFLLSLYIDFDFEAAAARQKEAEALLSLDFFLGAIKEEFMEQARILFFETLCRIHKSIDMKLLARLLDFGNDPERKVVDLIRTTRTDAKIDSDRNQLIMGGHYPSVYQQVIDKTRNISYRTNSLAQQVEKRYQQENQFDD